MKTLAVDIGNSTIVLGLIENNEVIKRIRFKSTDILSIDEYRRSFKSSLINELNNIDSLVVSSVVPKLTHIISASLEEILKLQAHFVSRSNAINIDLESIPSQMGNDLIANVVQASFLLPNKNVCVIDFGTALTFSTISKDKKVLGVAIAPGVVTGALALDSKTAQLHIVDIKHPNKALGLDTTDALLSGLVYGTAGAVKEIVNRIKNQINDDLSIILTGGLSEFMASYIDFDKIVDKYHTLKGIARFSYS